MNPIKTIRIFQFLSITLFTCMLQAQPAIILAPSSPSFHENLAAREVQRTIYLRTGELLPIQHTHDLETLEKDVFLIARQDRFLVRNLLSDKLSGLKSEQYLLKTFRQGGKSILCLSGGDDIGTLYAAYHLAEELGIRFYLHGDVIPDEQVPFRIPKLDHVAKPLFNIRGIQPFHDFPEGPDWWTADDYKAVFAQLIKMRMNFFGLHTYPQSHAGPEPTVWIGLEDDLTEEGDVSVAYPARHFTSFSGTWGYKPRRTSDYDFGAGALYERDDFGSCYMTGMTPWPNTDDDKIRMFNRTGNFFGDVFSFGRGLGLKTCIGTETFLTVPDELRARLELLGKSPIDSTVIESLYAGSFEWIKRNMPLDYYWFWTPEDWTWKEIPQKNVDSTMMDLKAAVRAIDKTGNPFTLATCGWVLGPEQDRSLFDNFLPRDMPFSCINRNVGFEPVEPDFARISGRPEWAIPWLEDDPAMIIPQFWVGRMRRDAADALAYGCSGLIGIHWRTRVLGMNVSALAKAGWEQPWNTLQKTATHAEAEARFLNKTRDLSSKNFYKDWALTQFGKSVAKPLAKLFQSLDGGPLNLIHTPRRTNLPRPAEWYKGPGGLVPDSLSWDERSPDYIFIETMEKLRPKVKGAGNRERFDYWLNQFKYLREVGHFNCLLGAYDRIEKTMSAASDKKEIAEDQLLPLRIEMMEGLKEIHSCFVKTINTPGALGNLTNWQQHIHQFYIEEPGVRLSGYLGRPLPAKAQPSKEPVLTKRIIVPTLRSVLNSGEKLRLKVILPGIKPASAKLNFRPLGKGEFETAPLDHVARAVYEVIIPSDQIGESLEYHIEVMDESGETFRFPATAPALNQTVVVTAK